MWKHSKLCLALVLCLTVVAGCSGGNAPDESSSASKAGAVVSNVSLNKDDYPVFPNADAGADPAVPAEQGGKGFKGEGWETNTSFRSDRRSKSHQGWNAARLHRPTFPERYACTGPEANSELNYMIRSLVYESLLGIHRIRRRLSPSLATHWQMSPDQSTFRFRIDPNARWSDGIP